MFYYYVSRYRRRGSFVRLYGAIKINSNLLYYQYIAIVSDISLKITLGMNICDLAIGRGPISRPIGIT